ncbi:MAG TPA: acylphosphatase, partial [Solirubrobacteraceae bacterium]
MSDTVRKRMVVRGRVQGVFFRDSVRERARAHGVSGWVLNRSDGAVEAVLEGPRDAVDRVARFVGTGP